MAGGNLSLRPASVSTWPWRPSGVLFAAPLNLTIGNLLSLYSPRKIDYSAFGRQSASQTTVLASLGVQIVLIGLGIGIFVLARMLGQLLDRGADFPVFAVISISIYVLTLGRMDGIAAERREALVAELCRASMPIISPALSDRKEPVAHARARSANAADGRDHLQCIVASAR